MTHTDTISDVTPDSIAAAKALADAERAESFRAAGVYVTGESRSCVLEPVTSSLMNRVGYVPGACGVLVVEFSEGTLREYPGVTRETYDALRAAPSPGKFFHAHIKGKYAAPVTPAPETERLALQETRDGQVATVREPIHA